MSLWLNVSLNIRYNLSKFHSPSQTKIQLKPVAQSFIWTSSEIGPQPIVTAEQNDLDANLHKIDIILILLYRMQPTYNVSQDRHK